MRNRVLTSTLVSLLALGALAPAFGDAKGVPNENAVGYWTQDRRDNAIAREFQFEPGAKVGKLVPQAKRGSSTGGSTTTSGTSYWLANQQYQFVAKITGKVFFTMNGVGYVCSGSLINDGGNPDIAIVVTAGHCVWDNKTGSWAKNWSFFPNYDSDNKTARAGEFPAKSLFARSEFTSETSFSMTAVAYDYAFALISPSSTALEFPSLPGRGEFVNPLYAYAFGYPQASPFNGNELVYSNGSLSTDPNSGNKTWKLASSLTAGASGGPWYSGYVDGNNVGRVGSVNSYKYTTDKNSMYGPQFSSLTTELLNSAKTVTCVASPTINCTVLP